jgi:Protein of unknown function (DUF664)
MASLELLFAAWDEGHREFGISLEGLPDEQLWSRPHPRLLSVGELASHIAYYESTMTTDPGPDKSLPPQGIKSDLIDRSLHYYPDILGHPFSRDLGTEALAAEIGRIHKKAMAAVSLVQPDSADRIPWNPQATWGLNIQYLAFHVAYHTGQIYSVRHLLGHTTTDN